jgi:hypothetical protein
MEKKCLKKERKIPMSDKKNQNCLHATGRLRFTIIPAFPAD